MPIALCRIVLVRPRDPNNIGAAARAMKNFGFTDLAVVAPYPPVWDEAVAAVNATDVLTGARVCASLAEAIADCNLVVGTAERRRVQGKQAVYTPFDLNSELRAADYRLALVFGSEKHGLTNEDLSHCHRVMSIPTQADCPSMNLGQAVAVCCYELSGARAQTAGVPHAPQAANAGAIETALQLALDVLRTVDFTLPGYEPALQRRLRRSLLRLNLTDDDVGMLCGVLGQIKYALTQKNGR